MIVTRLKGGLGNQMFQYAKGYAVSKAQKEPLLLDISWYRGISEADTKRDFALSCFSISEPFIDSETESLIIKNDITFLGKVVRKIKFLCGKSIETGNRILHLKNKFKEKVTVLDGFWTDERAIVPHRNDLIQKFKIKQNLSTEAQDFAEQIKNSNSVSIHIRRGDYVSNKTHAAFYEVIGLDFYKKAIETIKNKIGNESIANDLIFFIFSDDIAWAEENLILKKAVYVSKTKLKDYEELYLMSLCKHNIIANSTFSWWAAWLNEYTQKIVITPKTWFKKATPPKGLIPSSWILLDNVTPHR